MHTLSGAAWMSLSKEWSIGHLSLMQEGLIQLSVLLVGSQQGSTCTLLLFYCLQNGSEYAENRISLSVIYGPYLHRHMVYILLNRDRLWQHFSFVNIIHLQFSVLVLLYVDQLH